MHVQNVLLSVYHVKDLSTFNVLPAIIGLLIKFALRFCRLVIFVMILEFVLAKLRQL